MIEPWCIHKYLYKYCSNLTILLVQFAMYFDTKIRKICNFKSLNWKKIVKTVFHTSRKKFIYRKLTSSFKRLQIFLKMKYLSNPESVFFQFCHISLWKKLHETQTSRNISFISISRLCQWWIFFQPSCQQRRSSCRSHSKYFGFGPNRAHRYGQYEW